MSTSEDFFKSASFSDYRKLQEARQKMSETILRQIANTTTAVSNLGRALGRG